MTVPVAVVKAFLLGSGVAAGAQGQHGSSGFVRLEDDHDCHKFRLCVPHDFAKAMGDFLHDEGGESYAQVYVAVAPCHEEAHESTPTVEQLLAVWNASAFLVDYARDAKLCAVCDGTLPGHEEHDKHASGEYAVRHCNDECVAAPLRAARGWRP